MNSCIVFPDREPVRRDHLIAKLLGEAAPAAPVGSNDLQYQ